LSSGPAANDVLISGNVDIAMVASRVADAVGQDPGHHERARHCDDGDSPIFLMTVDPRIPR
jgi:hypothetical protein